MENSKVLAFERLEVNYPKRFQTVYSKQIFSNFNYNERNTNNKQERTKSDIEPIFE